MKNNRLISVLLIIISLILGSFLRFSGLGEKAFWLDEAWVAESLREKNFKDTLWYTRWVQSTPPGVLLLWKQIGTDKNPEASLRALPAFTGSLTIISSAMLAYSLTGRDNAAVYAAYLTALSPAAISLSRQLKQYSMELFMVSIVLLSVSSWSRRRTLISAVSAIFIALSGVFLSHLAPAAALGGFIALALESLIFVPGNKKARCKFAGVSIKNLVFPIVYLTVVVIAESILYLEIFQYQSNMVSRLSHEAFVPPGFFSILWYFKGYFEMFTYNWGFNGIWIFMSSAAGMCIAVVKRKKWLWLPEVTMIIMIAAAAQMGLFLFGGTRVNHGLAVIIMMPAVYFLSEISMRLSSLLRIKRALSTVLVCSLITAFLSGISFEETVPSQDLKSMTAAMKKVLSKEDTVWVYSHASHGFRYYINGEIDFHNDISVQPDPQECGSYIYEAFIENNSEELWTVFTHGDWENDADILSGILTSYSFKLKNVFVYDGAVLMRWIMEKPIKTEG